MKLLKTNLSLFTFLLFFLSFNVSENLIFAKANEGIEKGQKAILFKLPTLDGKELDLESFRKDKVVLLVFSATWCPACRHEIPILRDYYSRYKDAGLEIVNIDIRESQEKVKSFAEKNKINYTVLLDAKAEIASLYNVNGIPLNIILDKNGIIKYKDHSPPGEEIIKKLLSD